MSDKKGTYRDFFVDNGLLVGRHNFKLSFPDNPDSLPEIYSNLQNAWRMYRASNISYENFILELIGYQDCQINKHGQSLFLISHNNTPSINTAALIIIDKNLRENESGLFSFLGSSLSYACHYFDLRYGVFAQHENLIIFDFDDNEFMNKDLIINLPNLLEKDFEGKYFNFSVIFSCIYSYDAGGRRVKSDRGSKSSHMNEKNIIPNRNLYKDNMKIKILYDSLESKIFNLSKEIRFIENKMYTSYEYNGLKICEVHLQKTQIKIWIPLTINEIYNPQISVKDVREIGHYGTGASEFILRDENQIEGVMNIVSQSFSKVSENQEGK